jgi:hypothetical protein
MKVGNGRKQSPTPRRCTQFTPQHVDIANVGTLRLGSVD